MSFNGGVNRLTYQGGPQPRLLLSSNSAGTYAVDIGEQPLCLPDIAPIGAPNGEVNVDDLLAVINAWGACADPNNCPADIAPAGPPVGDDQVNVDDLLAVINGWGPCGK